MLKATGAVPAVVDLGAIAAILQAQGIGIEPTSECYVYPPADRFPQNALIRDSVDYFLHAQGMGRDRRIGILVLSPDRRLLVLVIEFSIFKQEIAEQIHRIRPSAQAITTDDILKNPAAVLLFRQLYTNVRAKFLGFNQQNELDVMIAKDAYSLLAMLYIRARPSQHYL